MASPLGPLRTHDEQAKQSKGDVSAKYRGHTAAAAAAASLVLGVVVLRDRKGRLPIDMECEACVIRGEERQGNL